MGIILSVFFAVGLILLTRIQHSGAGNQAGLDSFIFGQAASMVGSDVRIMTISAVLVTLMTLLFFKEFKLYCFDTQFAAGAGFSPKILDGVLLVLLTSVIVIGMQAVGVVLMAALLIIPATSARLWTNNLTVMVFLAGLFGALSGLLGTLLSTLGLKMPTGPLIVIAASLLFFISLVVAPKRGMLFKALRRWRTRDKVGREHVLRAFYEIAEEKDTWNIALTPEQLLGHEGAAGGSLRSALQQLVQRGLLQRSNGSYELTEAGKSEAFRITKQHRLWEMYLMHENQLAADHVHRDADISEHVLSSDLVRRLEALLLDYDLEMRLSAGVHTPDDLAVAKNEGGDA